ncbi:MAG: aromatic ring-hydroxylating dioxygenase subunit alpha [Pseudomonadota bacterium]
MKDDVQGPVVKVDPSTGLMKGAQLIPNGILEDNYPRNMWWCAAFASEVTEKPMGRWLLELPIVLYRLPDGTPVALDDRCPHRWAPLSQGKVIGNQLQCPYHGMTFGPDGTCTNVPTQDNVPKNARVNSYPLRESGNYIWIWMGDPEKIDCEPIDMSYTTDPAWSYVNGYYEVSANWVLIRENVMDLTHIAYLHADTFQQGDWNVAPHVSMDGDTIVYRQDFDPSPLSPLFCAGFGFKDGKVVKREQEGRMPTLAVSFSDWCVHDIDAKPGERVDYLVRGAHVVTPGKRGKTHYFWGAAFDVPKITEEVAAKTTASITRAFDEDRALLEAMQVQIQDDPRGLNYPEVNLAADGAAVRVRQILKRKLKAERGAAS